MSVSEGLSFAAQTVAVLAVQGAFVEHERRLERLGCSCIELRRASDLDKAFNRLVLPGGESTVQAKLLRELGMLEPLRERIVAGMPVLGTCAGLILLAERIEDAASVGSGSAASEVRDFATLPVTVRRNAFGRQLGSFHANAPFDGGAEVPMTFIRAPLVTEAEKGVETLARVGDAIVAVRYRNQIGVAFHPELDEDDRVLAAFLACESA
ncbi:pyridoxal 5'-phosphate synthase glutaminase subunit PdxT [Raoultibacter phocaeensis]|uniref:pyridoxal 5'-phosphate synthase glutaminase subunit PdxT n=1 Tax=Raoultibacter phocaeensis TaxID=2479841 RepID=UPI00111A306C|nr:pyridoxal 5'-phosphate synthase glutaminase subunit PdxT [Raoultibacter phocaeensis]